MKKRKKQKQEDKTKLEEKKIVSVMSILMVISCIASFLFLVPAAYLKYMRPLVMFYYLTVFVILIISTILINKVKTKDEYLTVQTLASTTLSLNAILITLFMIIK